MKKNKKTAVAFLGMLLGLAFVLAYIESCFPFLVGIYGVKLGLANLVVVIALYHLGEKEAFIVAVARIILVGFTFGNLFSMLYSLAGGILSFLVMAIMKKTNRFGMLGVSILGGVFHNVGQIFVAILIVENLKLVYYLPVLLISGVLTGGVIGIVAAMISTRITKVID